MLSFETQLSDKINGYTGGAVSQKEAKKEVREGLKGGKKKGERYLKESVERVGGKISRKREKKG